MEEAAVVADMMRAIEVAPGQTDYRALRLAAMAMPVPQDHELLIRVHGCGVNRPDLVQRQGGYPPPPGVSDLLGLEVSGIVVAANASGGRWKPGDQVVALLGGGGYAEYVAVDARHALPAPAGIDLVEAASLPETIFTVWANLFELGGLKAGETALIHGGNSGIGVTAIQMAKAAGARVIATARGDANTDRLRQLGADIALDLLADDFVGAIKAAKGVDVILDMLGAAYADANINVLKPGGRLVHIAFLTGTKAHYDVAKLMIKGLSITGSTLRYRPADEKARLAREIEQKVWPWIEVGRVRPVIQKILPLSDAWRAHEHLENGTHFGKVVLQAIDG